jgi:hypothetical protein
MPTGEAKEGLLMFDNTSPTQADFDALLGALVQRPQA